jgi:hypothetical protein
MQLRACMRLYCCVIHKLQASCMGRVAYGTGVEALISTTTEAGRRKKKSGCDRIRSVLWDSDSAACGGMSRQTTLGIQYGQDRALGSCTRRHEQAYRRLLRAEMRCDMTCRARRLQYDTTCKLCVTQSDDGTTVV